MIGRENDPNVALRWGVYGLLIALASGNILGRIVALNSVDAVGLEHYRIRQRLEETEQRLRDRGIEGEEFTARLSERRRELQEKLKLQRPFLSANDRSRWCAVRAIVEHGTYAIDDVVADPRWDTIDKVQHKDRDGVRRLYSSKPPLLPTLIAGEYWLIHRLTGATLGTHPYAISRFMLVTINLIPMIVMFLLLARMVERFGTTDWGRMFVMASATLGTLLTTFAVTLNNHIVAAVSVTIALYAMLKIWFDGERWLGYFVLAGLFAAFTAANELPAVSFLVLTTAILAWHAPRQTLLAYMPAALVVVAAFFATNKIAHDSWRPPYMHRSESDPDDNWYVYTYRRGGQEIHSYWENRRGIDRGEPSRAAYAFHATFGHHGIFSLTPVWLLSAWGVILWLRGRRAEARQLAMFILLLTVVCLVFYIRRPQTDRNYGGMTSGFRWMFWFAPMWLLTMLPAADRLATGKWTRALGLLLLALSVLSVSYPTWNPWVHPWIMQWMLQQGWIQL